MLLSAEDCSLMISFTVQVSVIKMEPSEFILIKILRTCCMVLIKGFIQQLLVKSEELQTQLLITIRPQNDNSDQIA